MATIKEDIAAASDWISKALQSSGYRADFTPQSLWEIDRFFDEHTVNGSPKPGGLLAESLGSRLFAIGSYIGEVIRRHRGGDWHGDDTDPKVEINVELRLADDSVCWPIQRAMKRFKNGPEDGIVAYGLGLGVSAGPRPEPQTKGFFRRLFGR
jgi:hypothetical protein